MKIDLMQRENLQDIRETAHGMTVANLNPHWVEAYRALAVAADHLDAMQARSEVAVCACGDPHEPVTANASVTGAEPQAERPR